MGEKRENTGGTKGGRQLSQIESGSRRKVRIAACTQRQMHEDVEAEKHRIQATREEEKIEMKQNRSKKKKKKKKKKNTYNFRQPFNSEEQQRTTKKHLPILSDAIHHGVYTSNKRSHIAIIFVRVFVYPFICSAFGSSLRLTADWISEYLYCSQR
jgi:hypothetical protein